VIAFLGSVFSPYYALARRRVGGADPLAHCAMNVALYGRGGKRWAMTERTAATVTRSPDHLAIGPSGMAWHGDGLEVHIDETSIPWPRRLRGTIRVHPLAVEPHVMHLDPAGRHRWQPIAPCARIEVAMTDPALRWTGSAYLDTNDGDRPLEEDFLRWQWSRAMIGPDTAIQYDVTGRSADTPALRLALRYDAAGGVREMVPAPLQAMRRTRWLVDRAVGGEPDDPARVVETLEDTPFYARSVVTTVLEGAARTAMHESLSLTRFRRPWIQAMLPFRMPRRFG